MDNLQMTPATMRHIPLLTPDAAFDAVVLGDGDYPSHPLPTVILNRAAYLCCCDGAGRQAIDRGRMPDAIVGDGDSFGADYRARYARLFHQVDEQDYNDLTKATRHCMAQGFRRLAYLGTTGKREDHMLGNISQLMNYARNFGFDVTAITDYGYFIPCHGDVCLETLPRQQVSLFNAGCSVLESEGLRWNTYPYTAAWQGTLNEALGTHAELHADGWYLLYCTFDAKQP